MCCLGSRSEPAWRSTTSSSEVAGRFGASLPALSPGETWLWTSFDCGVHPTSQDWGELEAMTASTGGNEHAISPRDRVDEEISVKTVAVEAQPGGNDGCIEEAGEAPLQEVAENRLPVGSVDFSRAYWVYHPAWPMVGELEYP